MLVLVWRRDARVRVRSPPPLITNVDIDVAIEHRLAEDDIRPDALKDVLGVVVLRPEQQEQDEPLVVRQHLVDPAAGRWCPLIGVAGCDLGADLEQPAVDGLRQVFAGIAQELPDLQVGGHSFEQEIDDPLVQREAHWGEVSLLLAARSSQ